jgi:hypothetical protein
MTRSMTLIKLYVVNALRSLGQEVQKRITDTKVLKSLLLICGADLDHSPSFTAVSHLRNCRHRSLVHQIYLVRLSIATPVG